MEEQNAVIAPVGAGEGSGVNDLIGVFGNDFINQNQPPPQQQQQQQRLVQFDEDTDSGKASPTSSETSSTTDEVTPRGAIEEEAAAEKITAPRVLPIVRSAEDIARKEKEIRESEERKSRLAAILAKSRGMASPMTNTLPPTADDIKGRWFFFEKKKKSVFKKIFSFFFFGNARLTPLSISFGSV